MSRESRLIGAIVAALVFAVAFAAAPFAPLVYAAFVVAATWLMLHIDPPIRKDVTPMPYLRGPIRTASEDMCIGKQQHS